MILATKLAAAREVTAWILTDPAVVSRATDPAVPSRATIVGAVLTAGLLILVSTCIIERISVAIGPAPATDNRVGFRILLSFSLALLAVATAVHLCVGP